MAHYLETGGVLVGRRAHVEQGVQVLPFRLSAAGRVA